VPESTLEFNSDLTLRNNRGEIRILGDHARLVFSCSDISVACRFLRTFAAHKPDWISYRTGRDCLRKTGTTLELAVGKRRLARFDGDGIAFQQANWRERLRLAYHLWRSRTDRKVIWS